MILKGTGQEVERPEDPLVLNEPTFPWRFSGTILIMAGCLMAYMITITYDFDDFFNYNHYMVIDIAYLAGLVIGGVMILLRERAGPWVIIGTVIMKFCVIPSFDGWTEWDVIVAIFHLVTCGSISVIPLIFGLKKGEKVFI